MRNISIDKTVLKSILDNSDEKTWVEIQWDIMNYSYVRKDEILGTVFYSVKEKAKIPFFTHNIVKDKEYKLVAPCDGFFVITEEERLDYDDDAQSYEKTTYFLYEEDDVSALEKSLAGIYKHMNEFFLNYYSERGSKLFVDPYTNSKTIKWRINNRLNFDGDSLAIDFLDGKCVCSLEFVDTLYKGDSISLLFKDGSIIDFPVAIKPIKNEPISFTLYQEDADLLLNSSLVSYRINFHTSSKRPKTILIDDNCFSPPHKDEAIHAYIKNRLETITKLVPDYQLPHRTVIKTPIEYKFNWCYVYLMRDNTNGYHKIGISNKPEYREKTLQSEKPSIEMLACKKFPTRKIAEAIESALHTAYSQQRVRGEWFNLNDEDVAAIIETLK